MTPLGSGLRVDIRPYAQEDEHEVVSLLSDSLGPGPAGPRTAEFFNWKHMANPFGRSLILVAEADGRIVGVRPFMRWAFRAAGRETRAVRAVDTATHPEYQGQGIFSALTKAALAELSGDVDLVFNTPNDKSGPGYLKLGWVPVGRMPIWIFPRHPVRLVANRKALTTVSHSDPTPAVRADSADAALRDSDLVASLLQRATHSPTRLATPRTVEYLRWRYASAPGLGYHALGEIRESELRGLVLFRLRTRGVLRECVVAELITHEGDRRTARRLLRRVITSCRVDHVACSFPPGSSARGAAASCGFLPSFSGIHFVVNPLRVSSTPNPAALASWACTLGDLEVF